MRNLLYLQTFPSNISSMAILKIARMGHPALVGRAEEIDDPAAPEVRQLIDDMIETMVDADGAGLAAPQVHVPKRLVIFRVPRDRDVTDDDAGDEDAGTVSLTVLINPEIEILTKDQLLGWEGCLSVPGLTGAVLRFTHIRYRGLTPTGETITREATDFHARVVQHECDHLDGLLFPMRMNDLSLLVFNEELRHFQGQKDEAVELDDDGDADDDAAEDRTGTG